MPEGIPDFSQDGSRPSVQTVQSGPWSSPSTWQGGVVPTSNHIVRILQAHTVTIQNESAAAYTVSVDGKLAFNPGVNTRNSAIAPPVTSCRRHPARCRYTLISATAVKASGVPK